MRRQCSRRQRASHPAAERPSHLLLRSCSSPPCPTPLYLACPFNRSDPESHPTYAIPRSRALACSGHRLFLPSPSRDLQPTVGQSRTVRAPASVARTRRWMPSWLLPPIIEADERKTNRIQGVQGEQTPTIGACWMNAYRNVAVRLRDRPFERFSRGDVFLFRGPIVSLHFLVISSWFDSHARIRQANDRRNYVSSIRGRDEELTRHESLLEHFLILR